MIKKIIIFGADNTGKTTLANNIVKRFPEAKVVKSLGPASYEDQVEYIESHVVSPDVEVFDRFPIIEEFTCGRVLRNKNNFSEVSKTWIKMVFDKIDLLIFCDPGMENILNWGTREQMEGIKENIEKLYKAYLEFPSEISKKYGVDLSKKLICYNWVNDDIEKIYRRVEDEY